MKYLMLILLLTIGATSYSQNMNNERLQSLIEKHADTVVGQQGVWQFIVNERLMLCITDSTHNRMRIISPIAKVSQLDEEEILNALVANFHTALDVKYAISDEQLWSVFIHPLKELSDAQVEDAIVQVYNAAHTFGTIYSSTNMTFPGRTSKEPPKPKKEAAPKLQKG